MKPGYVPRNPHFIRPVTRVFFTAAGVFLLLAAFVPAPLQQPADLQQVPNPVKAAWFLVWVQEVVSYGNVWIYPVWGLGLTFSLLPFLPFVKTADGARWFPGDQKAVNFLTLFTAALIITLTVVALCFRGENWHFVF